MRRAAGIPNRAQLDRLVRGSATIRLVLDARPTKEPYLVVLADRFQGSGPRP